MKTKFNFESIPFSAKYYGTRIIDGWEHNAWTVKVHGGKFPFDMGIGLVDKQGNPRVPGIKAVMRCLLSDMRAGDLPFEEFCSEFGYDEDSRKAYALWEGCKNIAVKIESLFSPDEIEAMEKALEDC